MTCQAEFLRVVHQLTAHAAVCCPAQILVIDRPNGPADILIDTISLLLECEISVTVAHDENAALGALENSSFQLIVVGLETNQPGYLSLLPPIHRQQPDIPVMVVGHYISAYQRTLAQRSSVNTILTVPQRAAELKALAMQIAAYYLRQARYVPAYSGDPVFCA